LIGFQSQLGPANAVVEKRNTKLNIALFI